MHILLLVDYFHPHIWGSEKLFCDLSNLLISEWYTVTVVTSRHNNSLPMFELISPRFQLYRVWSSRKDIRWYALRFGLRQKNLFQSIDLIHTSTFSACFPARILAWWYKKPVTITIHEFYLQMRTKLKWWKALFYRIYEYSIAYLPRDHIVTPSNYSKSTVLTIRPLLNTTISVVYNQIDYGFWKKDKNDMSQKDNERFLDSIALSSKRTCFAASSKWQNSLQWDKKWLYMGRLTKEKGVEYIIYALPLIQQHHPDFQLIIVSHLDTVEYKELKDLSVRLNIPDMIVWKESLQTEEEVRELMQWCILGIVPSMMEWFCYTAVQMQAIWLSLVVTDRGALPEVLDHQGVIFVPYQESKVLADAILHCINSPLSVHLSKRFNQTLVGYVDIFLSLYGRR